MILLILGSIMLLGAVLGYFLAWPLLVLITVVSIVIGAWMYYTYEQFMSTITIIFVIGATIPNILMWMTHFLVTKWAWIGNILHGCILR